jgi:response regulator RpfG family c-di-GMP phosphodiesterase
MARLVVIDDESHISDIITRFFREKGHDVVGTTSAEDALVHLKAHPVDLVITDIAMKGISGLDLLKRMKDLSLDIPVIVTTGNPSHSSAIQALQGGAFDYVVKPFHLGEISERAERALSTKRVKDENLLYSKLVSLHSISKVTAEAASLEDLATKVIKLGTRLTGSDGGWYWVSTPALDTEPDNIRVLYPKTETLELQALLLKLAMTTAMACEMQVYNETDIENLPAYYLTLPVEVSSALHGVLIFRRAKLQSQYDAVDLEVFNQLAATFALGIRALGIFPKPAEPDLSDGGKTLESWASLIGQMVDEHCAGYESKMERVEALGRKLMLEMNWPASQGESWSLVCRLYEIAKMRIPQKLLENNQILGKKDLDFVQAQRSWASERIKGMPGLETTAQVLADFQENYDGSGRPKGLRGRAIAPLARLLSVTDAYISMRSSRPYRKALTDEEAIEVIRKSSGKRFDPELVLALSKSMGI